MCGIFGEFGNILSEKSAFDKILKLSQNRGPDMVGYYSNSTIQFGFNRLSILDTTENGNQPIISPSGRFVVMCNGEIVNYHDIQNTCGISNNQLRSASDTEVLSHAIDCWGVQKMLLHIRGMYAMSIFDLKENSLHLIRDPAGIKPLYTAKTDQGWIFASQYDQIFKHPWYKQSLEINQEALSEYLQLGYIPAPAALFKKSWMVGPGECHTININFQVHIQKYYSFTNNNIFEETKLETKLLLKKRLQTTFPDYLHSDVPLGTFLSGGIDSPLVNAIISPNYNGLKAFTVSASHSGIDESVQAKKIGEHLNLDHHIELFNFRGVKDWIDDHFRAFSEPFADYSSLPTFILCKQAAKHHSVLLSGDGGDELFWGYPRFLETIIYKNWFCFPRIIRQYWAGILRRMGKRISSGIECDTIGDWALERQSPNYSTEVKAMLHNANNSISLKRLYSSPPPSSHPSIILNWLRNNEFYGHLQRVLLKVDRSSMAHSLEVRVPFLDRNILDFSSQIIPQLGGSHQILKYLLRETLKDYVPENHFLQTKQGFSIDLAQLLKNDLKEEVQDILYSKDIFPFNTLNIPIVRKKVEHFFQVNDENPWGLWILYSLQKFAITHNLV